jgi:MmgE/PrpD N-terminal domain
MAVLDSLACAIGALGALPIEAYLAQAQEFEEFGGSSARCTLIGGGQANVVYAAAYNTALVRYLDFMDSYLAGAELCHPSDNMGAVLAASEHAGGSGKDFLTSLAVAYEVEAALTAAAPSWLTGSTLRHSSLTRWRQACRRHSSSMRKERRGPLRSAVPTAFLCLLRIPGEVARESPMMSPTIERTRLRERGVNLA